MREEKTKCKKNTRESQTFRLKELCRKNIEKTAGELGRKSGRIRGQGELETVIEEDEE